MQVSTITSCYQYSLYPLEEKETKIKNAYSSENLYEALE